MKRILSAIALAALLLLPIGAEVVGAHGGLEGPNARFGEDAEPMGSRSPLAPPPLWLGAYADAAAFEAAESPWARAAANGNNSTPAAQITVEDIASKASGARALPAYSLLAFRLTAAEGDSIIFQADSSPGQFFDCYLFNAENYTIYSTLREGGNPEAEVSFFRDYTTRHTEHTSFTTEPLPPGTYYVVLDNDERLQGGANPTGNVTVEFALALVNNSLPIVALFVVLAGAAAAVYATVRWRPIFDAGSPLLDVDSGTDADGLGEDPSPHPDMDEGEGPPPHPP